MNETLEEIKEYIIKMKRTYTAFNEDAIGEVLVCEEMLKYIEYMEERDNEYINKTDKAKRNAVIEIAKEIFDECYISEGIELLQNKEMVTTEVRSSDIKITVALMIEEAVG